MSETNEQIRVLHVDDDSAFADLTAEFLRREDDHLRVEAATSASEGLERLAEAGDDVDCIVSDHDMPGRNGLEFLETVREEYVDLPFILYTGKGSEEVASEAISAGVTDYLQKESGTDQYTVLANRIRNAVEKRQAERARQRHLDAIETAQEGISILDEDGCYLYVNDAYADLFGYEPEEMLGEHWELVYPDDEIETVRDDILPHVREVGNWRGTTTGLRADGSTFLKDHNLAITDHDELICTVQDITARREHESALEAERSFIDQTLDALDDLVYVVDTDGALRRWNDQISEVTGYTDEELAGIDAIDLFPDDQRERLEDAVSETKTTGSAVIEADILTADRERIPYEFTGSRLTDPDGDVIGLVGVGRDITERKRREQRVEQLHTTAQSLMQAETTDEIAEIAVDAARDILDMPANGVHFYDEETDRLVPVDWTEYGEELVGEVPTFTPGESLAWDAFEQGEVKTFDDLSSVPGRQNPETEIRSELILPLDEYGVFLIGSTEVEAFDESDVSFARILATHMTIALDRLDRETELRETTARLEALYHNSPDMIDVLDPDGRLLDVNQRFCEQLGYAAEELLGRPIWEIDRDVDAAAVQELLSDVSMGERRRFEGVYERADGTTFPVEVHLLRLDLAGQDRFLAISRDISERTARERELERYETIVQALGDPVYVIDADGCYTFVNDAFVSTTGYARDDLLGEHTSTVVPEDAVEKGIELTRELLRDDEDATRTCELEIVTADGERIPCENHISLLPFDEGGEFSGSAGVVRDISERKERERRLRRQKDRLGAFANVVSHDLRNPLNVAEGRIELAREECESDHLDGAAAAVTRSLTLIDDLLTLAREGEEVDDLSPVDLSETAEACWQNVAMGEATLDVETDQTIRADENRMKQLFENLMRNAVEHSSTDPPSHAPEDGIEHGGDDVTVTVDELDAEPGFYVEDDGPGIPAEERERVFEAGYSTSGRGTGFGLNIVQTIVDAHGWDIHVTDSPTGGARFEITGVALAEE